MDSEFPTISLLAVDGAPRQLAYASVDAAERADTWRELKGLGHEQGYYAMDASVAWRATSEAFEVWAELGTGLRATAGGIRMGDVTIARAASVEIIAFLWAEMIRRGVIVRADGVDHEVAGHISLRPGNDWSYGAMDAQVDSSWTNFLGRQLADWLKAPFSAKT